MASPSPVLDELGSAYPDHHLWRNGRLWWIAFTIHRGHLQERVRHSLGTADLVEARARRDEVLARYAQAPDCRLSLRSQPPRRLRVAGGAGGEPVRADLRRRLAAEGDRATSDLTLIREVGV